MMLSGKLRRKASTTFILINALTGQVLLGEIHLSGNATYQDLTCVDVWKNKKSVIPIQMTTPKNTIETANHANAIFTGGRDWKSALATNVGSPVIKSMKRENQEEFCSLSRTYKTTSNRMLNREESKTAMNMRGIVLIQP
jgi:hypothetical protein